MAVSDYITCDKCNSKVAYDGNWEVRDNAELDGSDLWALCATCKETHFLSIREKAPKDEGGDCGRVIANEGELSELRCDRLRGHDGDHSAEVGSWSAPKDEGGECLASCLQPIHNPTCPNGAKEDAKK